MKLNEIGYEVTWRTGGVWDGMRLDMKLREEYEVNEIEKVGELVK